MSADQYYRIVVDLSSPFDEHYSLSAGLTHAQAEHLLPKFKRQWPRCYIEDDPHVYQELSR